MERRKYSKLKEIPSGNAGENITEGCLVLEGGAFRGLYSQGVMDALMKNDINFACVIGVSAGALSGVSYVSGQIGRSARVNLGYRHDSSYVGMKAFFRAHSPIRLDFCFDDYNKIEPLNEERFFSGTRRFLAVATSCVTGETLYFEKGKCDNIFSAIKASASMPYISPMVEVDGIPCLDGGCSCKIPYQWAISEGYEKIVVIRTREPEYRKKVRKRSFPLQSYRKYPEFAAKLAESNRDYNAQCEEISALEQSGRIFVLNPSSKVTVSRIEGDMEKLGELYRRGYADTLNRLDALREYLSGAS